MFEKAFILAGAITAILTSNTQITLSDSELFALKAHLPEFSELSTPPESPSFRIDDQTLEPDLPHLLYGMARKCWLNQGFFVIHSACIGNESEGYVLLVGQAGSGKTSTALECVRRHGLKFFSGDKTVIEVDENADMWAIGGTKVLTSRQQEEGRWDEMIEKVVRTSSRYSFSLKNTFCSSEKRVPIKAVVLLNLNDGRELLEDLSKMSAVHTLYPFFMDTQNADVLLDDGDTIFDGAIELHVKEKHVPRLVQGIKKIRTIKVIGSMDSITEEIGKLFKERILL